VDCSRSGIEIARRENPGMPFVLHDLCQPPAPEWLGRFDAVVAIELIDHLALPRLAIDSALLALKPGGLLIVSVPHHGYAKNLCLALAGRFDMRWQSLDDHGRMRFYSRHTLTALMREFELHDLRVETAGRLPPISRSLIASGHAPR
jgi:2-polyprenyl-6-hydroxyphenyl methylase/3-demethylubiquinone-9 3-methyltransferase